VQVSGQRVQRLRLRSKLVGPLRAWPGGLCLARSIGDVDVGPNILGIPEVPPTASTGQRAKICKEEAILKPAGRIGCTLRLLLAYASVGNSARGMSPTAINDASNKINPALSSMLTAARCGARRCRCRASGCHHGSVGVLWWRAMGYGTASRIRRRRSKVCAGSTRRTLVPVRPGTSFFLSPSKFLMRPIMKHTADLSRHYCRPGDGRCLGDPCGRPILL
jgi:hypothetical protein